MSKVEAASLHNLEWNALLEHLALLAQTATGADRLREIPLNLDMPAVETSLMEIEEARLLLKEGTLPGLGGVADLSTVLQRARKGATLEGEELRDILRCEQLATEIREVIAGAEGNVPRIERRAASLRSSADFNRRLERSIGEDGELLDSASPALASLRRDVINRAEGIRTKLDEILRSPKFTPFLQDDFYTLRENRYVVPLKTGAQAQIKGIVHDTSNTGASVFIEPQEIIDANNSLKLAERALKEEEDRIRRELSDMVRGRAADVASNGAFLIELDVLLAKARLAERLKAAPPSLATGQGIVLKEMVHPLLALSGGNVIPNDLDLSSDCHTLVISGPNAGGKTVLLKALGLSALLLKAGLPIPAAKGSRLPVFEGIFADIGDSQSITEHLSSFTGHLTHIGQILSQADGKSLVLLDEVMSGTAPTEGAALAAALLEYLESRVALTVATTHYDEIKTMAGAGKQRLGLSMGFDAETFRPTYRVQRGPAARSLAFEAARQAGLPADLLDLAKANLSPARQAEYSQLEKLEAEGRRLARLQEETRDAQEAATRLQQKYDAELAAIRRKDERALQSESRALREDLSRLRAELKNLRRRQRIEGLKEEEETLARAASRAEEAIARVEARQADELPPETPLDWEKIKPGDRVRLAGSRQEGTLIELPDSQGRARVEIGGGRMVVDKGRLCATSEPVPERAKREVVTAAGIVYEVPEGSSTTLDLRGWREEDALQELTGFLDRATLSGLGEVIVIHGHGEGILKKAVRQHLRTSGYVASFRPGGEGEGGDGVTVITLR